MKTETKIAKRNMKLLPRDTYEIICKEHLASCQRFLEFLEMIDKKFFVVDNPKLAEDIIIKIKDIKQAIKTYKEAGIK